jgi:hypothetical protein
MSVRGRHQWRGRSQARSRAELVLDKHAQGEMRASGVSQRAPRSSTNGLVPVSTAPSRCRTFPLGPSAGRATRAAPSTGWDERSCPQVVRSALARRPGELDGLVVAVWSGSRGRVAPIRAAVRGQSGVLDERHVHVRGRPTGNAGGHTRGGRRPPAAATDDDQFGPCLAGYPGHGTGHSPGLTPPGRLGPDSREPGSDRPRRTRPGWAGRGR